MIVLDLLCLRVLITASFIKYAIHITIILTYWGGCIFILRVRINIDGRSLHLSRSCYWSKVCCGLIKEIASRESLLRHSILWPTCTWRLSGRRRTSTCITIHSTWSPWSWDCKGVALANCSISRIVWLDICCRDFRLPKEVVDREEVFNLILYLFPCLPLLRVSHYIHNYLTLVTFSF